MPRQDVPYGGAICRLRERIAEIFDKLGEKLHTINGVPGDGDGNVKIVSGSSAVVISNDPTQNEIAVSLDTSQLPAAAVSSVNGQTGAVALDAGDIPTVGGDVQADLQDLANDISGNTAAINAEVLARQGADSALQTNINTVNAAVSLKADAANVYTKVETDAKIQTDLNAYPYMVRTTGVNYMSGSYENAGPFVGKFGNYGHSFENRLLDVASYNETPANSQIFNLMSNFAADGTFLNELRYVRGNDGNHSLEFVVHMQDDTFQYIRMVITQ